jgi:hypothetical protein
MLAARITELHVCAAFGGPIVIDPMTTAGVIIVHGAPTVPIGR